MATNLKRSISRETPVDDGNGRNLIITINAENNTLEFKPKGRTIKALVSMPIQKVYALIKNAQTL